VRRSLGRAALSALRYHPAVRALYARVVAKHLQQKAAAVGHAMRKPLRLVCEIWKSGRPFDPGHSPWQAPAHVPAGDPQAATKDQAAGPTPDTKPATPVVTAAGTDHVGAATSDGARLYIDLAHIQRQLPLARVLDHLGQSPRLRGTGPQRRGACPLHRGDARGRTFSVNLDDHVFQCCDKRCGRQGDVIDLGAAWHGMALW
jgi:hypothetical protein